MVSTPVNNFSNFLKNRPTLVVFLICLVILAVTTFYFAFEIEKDDPIIDSDKKHDWIGLIKHLNKLDICIGVSKWRDELEVNRKDTLEEVVYTSVKIDNLNFLQSFSEVRGVLILDEWYPISCQDKEKQSSNLSISFNVPALKETNLSQNICVTIKGPADYLPYFKNPQCKPPGDSHPSKGNIGILTSKLRSQSNATFCNSGKSINMVFDLKYEGITNYLNDDIRTQIYIHLMWCSYFLVFVIFIFLIVAIVKKPDYLEKKEQSARLL